MTLTGIDLKKLSSGNNVLIRKVGPVSAPGRVKLKKGKSEDSEKDSRHGKKQAFQEAIEDQYVKRK